MPDFASVTWETAPVLAAFAKVEALIETYTDLAAQETAEALAAEARARVNRRGPDPTAAQVGRPPLEDLIVVEPMKKGNGYVVVVKNPEGAFDSEVLLLSWWLAATWSHNTVANRFLWDSRKLEEGPHRARILEAVQRAITESGLGD